MDQERREKSAADPELLMAAAEQYMHTREERERIMYETEMFDQTRRAGAGGVKAGVVGLHIGGKKLFEDFHNTYTSPDKPKKPRDRYEGEDIVPDKNAKPADVPHKLAIMLPRTFCPDCDRSDADPNRKFLTAFTTDDPDEAASLHIKPMEPIVYSVCTTCQKRSDHIGQELQKDAVNHLQVVGHDGYPAPLYEVKAEEWHKARLERIRKNVCDYIRAARHNPEGMPIFMAEYKVP